MWRACETKPIRKRSGGDARPTKRVSRREKTRWGAREHLAASLRRHRAPGLCPRSFCAKRTQFRVSQRRDKSLTPKGLAAIPRRTALGKRSQFRRSMRHRNLSRRPTKKRLAAPLQTGRAPGLWFRSFCAKRSQFRMCPRRDKSLTTKRLAAIPHRTASGKRSRFWRPRRRGNLPRRPPVRQRNSPPSPPAGKKRSHLDRWRWIRLGLAVVGVANHPWWALETGLPGGYTGCRGIAQIETNRL
jgi:hypothetical protein